MEGSREVIFVIFCGIFIIGGVKGHTGSLGYSSNASRRVADCKHPHERFRCMIVSQGYGI